MRDVMSPIGTGPNSLLSLLLLRNPAATGTKGSLRVRDCPVRYLPLHRPPPKHAPVDLNPPPFPSLPAHHPYPNTVPRQRNHSFRQQQPWIERRNQRNDVPHTQF